MPSQPTVLYVEDNLGDIQLFEAALLQCRFSLSLHAVGEWSEAFAFLEKRDKYWSAPTPGLILLDLNLPVVGGREILRKLQADPLWRNIPVVVFSSSHRAEEIDECYALGACLYVIKPSHWERYVDIVAAIAKLAGSGRGVLSKDPTPAMGAKILPPRSPASATMPI